MTKHRTLKDALIGETVTVGKLAGEGPVRRRIMDMGVTKGTQIHPQSRPSGRSH